MKTYKVTFIVEVEADDPIEAGSYAWEKIVRNEAEIERVEEVKE